MRFIDSFLAAASMAAMAGPATAQTLGRGGSLATGGAGPDGAQGASEQLERCDSPKGTIAVVEPQNQVQANLQRYGLGSPTSVIRMMVQQSNCFQVVERGTGMRNMMQERALGASGELQADQNIGKGQMVAADFIVTPSVVFSENNAGGIGGALGGLIGGSGGRALAGVAGGVKFKEAETSMLLVDSRSGIQVAAAQGSAAKTDFAIGGTVVGRVAAAGGGYSNTNEGKMIVASFMDNWNNIVRNVRNNPSLVQARAGEASQRNAATSVVVLRWPWGKPIRSRSPRRQRPWLRVMLVAVQVSSMNTSRAGSRSSWRSNHASRRLRTSGRSCSLAWPVFFCA